MKLVSADVQRIIKPQMCTKCGNHPQYETTLCYYCAFGVKL